MKVLPASRRSDQIADLKVAIIRQQALVAELFRAGKRRRASAARAKLYLMLNKLDLLEAVPALAQPAVRDSGPSDATAGAASVA
jgi:hypothetical protein